MRIGKEEYLFDAIQALVKKGNTASIKLCEKLGFSYAEKVWNEKEEYLRFL